MAKFKKDGITIKLSGGSNGGGRPRKYRKRTTLDVDNDLVEKFSYLSCDEKNIVIRNGLSL